MNDHRLVAILALSVIGLCIDALQSWAKKLMQRKPFKLVAVCPIATSPKSPAC
jgi:hypothetical protein